MTNILELKQPLTQDRLKEVLHYDPDTGIFTWLISNNRRIKIGDVAGSKDDGYIRIRIDGKLYLAHRLAFLYMTGGFPVDQCDHINHERSDNSWKNLREATSAINRQNTSMRSDNTSGCMGVAWNKRDKKWMAHIQFNGKFVFLGYFTDWFEAVCARKIAENKYGFHPNHGLNLQGY